MNKVRTSRQWLGRGVWAIADQGLFALANVALNVLLARWLDPDAYGAFAVGYALYLFIGAFHTALLTEPLLVFGPGKFASQAGRYFALLLRGHWLLTGTGSLLLFIGGGLLSHFGLGSLSQAMFGLALAAPFSLLMWFGRRAAYLQFKTHLATAASGGYLLLLLAALLTLAANNLLTIFTALLAMSVAGAIAGCWLTHSLRRSFGADANEGHLVEARSIAIDHWRYGRWAAATAVLMWVPLNFFFVVLSVLVNFEASATLKALSNLVLPLLQANAAWGSLLLPALVMRARYEDQFKKLLRSALGLFAAAASLYALGVGLCARPLVHQLYGGRYDSQVSLLWLLLLIPLADGVMVVISSALRSLERPDRVFWAQLVVAGFVLLAGLAATRASGLWGAAAAIVVADLLGVFILGIGVLTQLQHRTSAESAVAVEAAS